MTQRILDVANLAYAIGDKRIITDISFSMSPNEMRAVIGPNGAGKSTCVRCLCGIAKGWTGTVRLAGKNIARINRRDLARLVCYLPQSQGTPPAFTVWDYVSMGRYAHAGLWGGLTKNDADIIDDALAAAGIAPLRDRLLPTLSGGELQMAAIAAGLAQGAKLFVLDEPATFLDPVRQEMLLNLLSRLNRERGVAILMITHDINAALHSTGQTLALRDGQAVFDGPSPELATGETLRRIYGMDFAFARLPGGTVLAAPASMDREAER